MLISDIMSASKTECTEDTAVEKVYELIQKSDHGFVVIIDSESHRVPLGVVTEHSICEQLVAKNRNVRGLTAGAVLEPRVKKIPGSTPAAECLKSLTELPRTIAILAVDDKGALCGVVSRSSLEANAATLDRDRDRTPPETQPERNSDISREPALGWVH